LIAALDAPLTADAAAVLQAAWRQMAAAPAGFGPEALSAPHNPFGRAAQVVDSWALLEYCQSPDLLDAVEAAIGADIILWDSEFVDGPAAAHHDPALWPLDPPPGITLRAAVGDGVDYVIRYLPSTARYNRDPTYPPNRRAAERAPLINFTRRPIWLVRGVDRADNDFVTGFASTIGQWSDAPW
jgi:hypothetical protein